ncbi:hypothetical protein [Treponema sp. R6D11]
MKKIILITAMALLIISPLFSDEYEDAKNLLLKEEGGDIVFLSKINLGIPGVVSWIANRGRYTYIYNIDKSSNVTRLDMIGIAKKSEMQAHHKIDDVDLEFVFENIPGAPLGDKAAMIGDYNGDGNDEILCFDPLGPDETVNIYGYNTETNEMYFSFYYSYSIFNRECPLPVEFVNYQGVDGIKVNLLDIEKNYCWVFVAWDKGSRKYVILAEKGKEDIDYSKFTPIPPKTDNESDGEQSKTESTAIDDKAIPLPLWAWFAIVGGAVVVVGGVVFVVKRKKVV